MFYELIYTRCRRGIDIMRNGQAISSDGYKVYSCTPAIMEEGKVDLQFLANVAQAKQSYTDPGFMDDAYLFYVPDTGKSIFINFHPVHFDPNAPGDYSHRPGNFVNHALIGDFSQIYPYQMFQDDAIWSAKVKGEAYYYENESADLPERGDITSPPGQYKFDEIGDFIADGRKEALQKAVAFLIAQYGVEPEKRKYLVIKDDTSRNIELWIAAIECAFSPQMASVIPFATRMDKFANLNRYTVKQGIYQAQMNLQDPNHKQRYRAMIVGVDERDKSNASTAKPLANSPFVLLDGKLKQAQFETDTSNRYYKLITQFDGEHQKFTKVVLPTFCVSQPTAEIFELYEIFSMFNGPSMPNAQTLASILGRMSKFQATGSSLYSEIYDRVKGEASRCMQEDFSVALNILGWLQTASKIVNDTGAKQWLTETVCNAFSGIVFGKIDNAKKLSYWAQIRRSEFAPDVARVISASNLIIENKPNINKFDPADVAAFAEIYMESASMAGGIDQSMLRTIIKFGVEICCRDNDTNSLDQLGSILTRNKINAQELLFAVVNGDGRLGAFVINNMINHDASIFASDNSLVQFCQKLNDGGLGHLIDIALTKRLNVLSKAPEVESFVKTLKVMTFIGEDVLAKIFEAMDARVSIATDSASPLVELLQKQKPPAAICKNSAHLFALRILSDNRARENFADSFNALGAQGFPSITDGAYINTLVEHLIKAKLSNEEQLFLIDILFGASPEEYFSAYTLKLIPSAGKNRDKWNVLVSYVSGDRNKQRYEDALVQALVNSKLNEKSLDALGSLIEDDNIFNYFESVAAKAKEIILSQKPKSVFGKIFGKAVSEDDGK